MINKRNIDTRYVLTFKPTKYIFLHKYLQQVALFPNMIQSM